ncbi:uncharacterized protein LOC121383842 [Gigantopelta aegis]|uniref:uncharacterized protein LOC121383842 n=1 Tax=Gigantopelta aegis TaxID=1735272 RepID=UPI001B88C7D9|nr:uncharacterized protein LOC121383842 [Gigantopelta aegis]
MKTGINAEKLIQMDCQYVLEDGQNYSIGGTFAWLYSAPTFFFANNKLYSTEDGSLTSDKETTMTSGMDKLGPWQSISIHYSAGSSKIIATMKTYQTPLLPLIIFRQTYVNGANATRAGTTNQTIGGYPSFLVQEANITLGYLSFGGDMFGDISKRMGIWKPGTDLRDGMTGSGPLAVFDEEGRTLVFVPLKNFMSASMWHDQTTSCVSWGIMGGVDSVPAGFEHETLVYYSPDGINEAFRDLGYIMRFLYRKTSYFRQLDLSLNYLGYWTDNGAYYYYNTEANKTYEETIIDIKTYTDQINLPIKYFQVDSWWYYKGPNNGVTLWEPMPEVFPRGLKFLQKKLGVPIVAHNRYWSTESNYSKVNGGNFTFIEGKRMSLPNDPTFWNYLLGRGKQWDLIVYEQDWLNVQLLGLADLQTNLNLGRNWLQRMAEAAEWHDLRIQYCMALSRHALQSIEFPVVTQARVSTDYHLRDDQWKIGITSIFADAMGVAPSKDTFWTTSDQPGNPFFPDKTELFPEIETLVAVLSTGPVGPGDMINGTDRSLLMKCCNENGLILKPSKPATAINAQIMEAAFNNGRGTTGEVWSTYCDLEDVRFGIIFATSMSAPYNLTWKGAGFRQDHSKFEKNKLYSAHNTSWLVDFDEEHSFVLHDCSLQTPPYYCLFYTSPVIEVGGKKIVLLGDLTKFVPMSSQRIFKLWLTLTTVAVTLKGKVNEMVHFSYYIDDVRADVNKTADSKECATFVLYTTTPSPASPTAIPPYLDCTIPTVQTTTTAATTIITTAKATTTTSTTSPVTTNQSDRTRQTTGTSAAYKTITSGFLCITAVLISNVLSVTN